MTASSDCGEYERAIKRAEFMAAMDDAGKLKEGDVNMARSLLAADRVVKAAERCIGLNPHAEKVRQDALAALKGGE
jgi:hypothetical protein